MERTLKWLFYFIFFFFNIANVCSQGYIIENFDLSLNEFLEVSTRKDNLLPIVDSKRVIMFYPPSKGIRKVFAAFDFDSYAKKYLFKKNKYGLFLSKLISLMELVGLNIGLLWMVFGLMMNIIKMWSLTKT
ncbi:Putative Outer Membrane Protein [Borrelia nietonii YOR]|uniref:Outer Membrane Protein n=1 Tax=Borrelia nietonii YOR TaxID=1293576 RepID=A0ABM5PIB3_9SPIR|nr:Putative Outer Membrane Protein [Borrelia nietonii YOR]